MDSYENGSAVTEAARDRGGGRGNQEHSRTDKFSKMLLRWAWEDLTTELMLRSGNPEDEQYIVVQYIDGKCVCSNSRVFLGVFFCYGDYTTVNFFFCLNKIKWEQKSKQCFTCLLLISNSKICKILQIISLSSTKSSKISFMIIVNWHHLILTIFLSNVKVSRFYFTWVNSNILHLPWSPDKRLY